MPTKALNRDRVVIKSELLYDGDLRREATTIRKTISLEESGLVLVHADICTTESGRRILESMKECPHLVHMMEAHDDSNRFFCLFALPNDKVWWVTAMVDDPSVIRATSVRLAVGTNAYPPEVSLPCYESKGGVPCGGNCATCPQYDKRCKGCPASRYYKD